MRPQIALQPGQPAPQPQHEQVEADHQRTGNQVGLVAVTLQQLPKGARARAEGDEHGREAGDKRRAHARRMSLWIACSPRLR